MTIRFPEVGSRSSNVDQTSRTALALRKTQLHSFGVVSRYNNEHFHSRIVLMTPGMIHYGQAGAVRAMRQKVLDVAYIEHPGHFIDKNPTPLRRLDEVWINSPTSRKPKDNNNQPLTETHALSETNTPKPTSRFRLRQEIYMLPDPRTLSKLIQVSMQCSPNLTRPDAPVLSQEILTV